MSTVWQRESDDVRILWVTMLAVKDSDHVVRKSLFQLEVLAKMSQERVKAAMEILMGPDTHKEDPGLDGGARVKKISDEEWLIINGDKYQKKMLEIFRRARNAAAMRERRHREKLVYGAASLAERNAVAREQGKSLEQAIEDERREKRAPVGTDEPDPVYNDPPDDSGEVKG